MKIGDMVKFVPPSQRDLVDTAFMGIEQSSPGLVVDFPIAKHAKEFRKVTVLTNKGLESWVMQFCEVIDESR